MTALKLLKLIEPQSIPALKATPIENLPEDISAAFPNNKRSHYEENAEDS